MAIIVLFILPRMSASQPNEPAHRASPTSQPSKPVQHAKAPPTRILCRANTVLSPSSQKEVSLAQLPPGDFLDNFKIQANRTAF